MTKEVKWLLDEKYQGKKTKSFYKDVKRLEAGEPVDYVIGFTEFLGCKIDLSKKPLIPRPETEYWVASATKNILTNSSLLVCCVDGRNRKIKILDMFAGSGCIGVAMLKSFKNAMVTFADRDKKCLEQIKINLKLNTSLIRANKGRFIVRQTDVFDSIKNKSAFSRVKKFDYIFANPPYIPTTRKNKIQKSVLKYEPRKALFAGKDGLFFINKFLKDAQKYLNAGGIIFMEFSPEQKKEIEKLIKKHKYYNWEFKKDQYNRWRWVEIL